MRRYMLLMVAMMVSLLGTATTRPADPKDKEPEKKRSNQAINGKKMFEWMDDLKSTDPSILARALATLKVYGFDAREAVPLILKALNHKDASVRVNAVITLGFIGFDAKDREEGTNAAIRLLSDRESIVRYQAARTLARLASAGQLTADGPNRAVPHLINALGDRFNCEIRAAAANALGPTGYRGRGTADRHAFYALLACLNDKNENSSDVRLQAIVALIVLGAPADRIMKSDEKNALNRLVKTLMNDHKQPEKLGIWARVVLMDIDGEISQQHLSAIASHLKDRKLEPRVHAARALATLPLLNLDIKSRLSDLIKALDDKEPDVVFWAVQALGEMGEDAEMALDALQKLTSHPDPIVQQGAKQAIENIKTLKKRNDLKKKGEFAAEKKKKQP